MRQAITLRHETFTADVHGLVAQLRRSRRAHSLFNGEWRTSDLSRYLPRVLDCGSEGTVAAVSIVNALELLLARSGATEQLSVRYLYEKAVSSQQDSQRGNNSVTEGIFMEAALFVATFFGVPRERIWPYVAGHRELPRGRTWQQLDAKRGWCCRGDFFRADGLADAVRQLAAGRPIVAGASFYDDTWFSRRAMKSGEVPMPPSNAGFLGEGTVLLVGYDAVRRRFRLVGPWGSAYGRKGFGTLELDTARRLLDPESLWSVALASKTVADLRERKAALRHRKPKG
jgi:hypothetical protein